MPIQVQCPRPTCRHVLTVRDEMAGKKGLCPKCHGVIAVPGGEPVPPSKPAMPAPAPKPSAPVQAAPPKPRPPVPAQAAPPPPPPVKEPEFEIAEDETPPERQVDDLEVVEEEEPLDDLEVIEREKRRPKPRRKKSRGGRGDWDKVHTGLNMVLMHLKLLIGLCVGSVVLCCIGFLIGLASKTAAAAGGTSPGALGGAGILGLIVGIIFDLVLLASGVLWVLGLLFCAFAPTNRGCRALALVALGCAVGSFVFSLFGFVFSLFGILDLVGGLLMLGGIVLGPLSIVAFLLFLRSAAAELRDAALARSVLTLLIVLAATWVGEFLIFFLVTILMTGMASLSQFGHMGMGGAPSLGAGFGLVFFLVALVVGIAEFIWYVNVVSQMRELVGNRLGGY